MGSTSTTTVKDAERELRNDLVESLRAMDDFRAERVPGWEAAPGLVEEFSRRARAVADDAAALSGYYRHFGTSA